MNALRKVLVVDSGHRRDADLLSTELAELGLSSVTTSLEAADDVLHVIETPSAIFLNMPRHSEIAARSTFQKLAASLRAGIRTRGIPVIEWERDTALQAGGISAVLKAEIGPQALSGYDP